MSEHWNAMEMKLKEVLQRELKSKNVSLNELARNTKIPLSTLHNWSQGMAPNAKNIKFLKTLSEYFGITLSVLLFNTKEDKSESTILFCANFVDDDHRYRLTIEKVQK